VYHAEAELGHQKAALVHPVAEMILFSTGMKGLGSDYVSLAGIIQELNQLGMAFAQGG
jgi:hypothetical protein